MRLLPLSFPQILEALQPLLYSPTGGGAWCLPAAAGWQSWQGVAFLWWVVVVGKRQAPEMFSFVVVAVVGRT